MTRDVVREMDYREAMDGTIGEIVADMLPDVLEIIASDMGEKLYTYVRLMKEIENRVSEFYNANRGPNLGDEQFAAEVVREHPEHLKEMTLKYTELEEGLASATIIFEKVVISLVHDVLNKEIFGTQYARLIDKNKLIKMAGYLDCALSRFRVNNCNCCESY